MDGLSLRAGHPPENIIAIHGDLWTLKCENEVCGYSEKNMNDPVVPALNVKEDFPDDDQKVEPVPRGKLPRCPECPQSYDSLLRPGVVFFDELLPGLLPYDLVDDRIRHRYC